MPLLSRCSELHLALRSRNDDAVLVQARRHWVRVQDRAHRVDVRYQKIISTQTSNTDTRNTLTALSILLRNISRTRIRRTPIQSPRIRMYPEEPLVSSFSMALPNRLPRILIQELANHRLRDCVDNRGVRRARAGHVSTCRCSGCICLILPVQHWLRHTRVEIGGNGRPSRTNIFVIRQQRRSRANVATPRRTVENDRS